jgi:mannose-6-phosphate isomerase-like protein (cupin superfamily)
VTPNPSLNPRPATAGGSQTTTLTAMSFKPSASYALLSSSGAVQLLPGGDAFWSQPEQGLEQLGQDWLVSEFSCRVDWPNWEMHPHADEFVYLLDGDIEFQLELPSGIQGMRISGSGAVVVPKGVWHTAKVFAESRMLFVTMGTGTQHRPAEHAAYPLA